MIDWTPIVFVTFKLLMFGTAMFFAIKWHYDKEKEEKDKRALLRTCGKIAAVFVLLLLGLGSITFVLVNMVGMELTFP